MYLSQAEPRFQVAHAGYPHTQPDEDQRTANVKLVLQCLSWLLNENEGYWGEKVSRL